MQILGIIILVTGIILLLVSKNISGNLPPNYQSAEDDGFLQLLQSMGKMVGGAGVFLVVIGVICILLGIGG